MNTTVEDTQSFVYEGREYYNLTNAAQYVGVTDAGLRRRMKEIERENNIVFPTLTFPTSAKKKRQYREVYINSKILDILRKPVLRGKEQDWFEKLNQAIENEIKNG